MCIFVCVDRAHGITTQWLKICLHNPIDTRRGGEGLPHIMNGFKWRLI